MNESQAVLLVPRSKPRHIHGDRISLTDPVTRGWSIHTQHIHTPTWLLGMVFRILATLTEYLFINHVRLFISLWKRARLSFVSLTPTLFLELTEEVSEGSIHNTDSKYVFYLDLDCDIYRPYCRVLIIHFFACSLLQLATAPCHLLRFKGPGVA